jgi:hypothetical protein
MSQVKVVTILTERECRKCKKPIEIRSQAIKERGDKKDNGKRIINYYHTTCGRN